MHAPERLVATRVAASTDAIDRAHWPTGAIVLRTAPDEAVVLATIDATLLSDPHAIVARETSLYGVWLDRAEAIDLLERHCDWELPPAQSAFAQGAVAGLPLKLWFAGDRVLFVVPAAFVVEFTERCR